VDGVFVPTPRIANAAAGTLAELWRLAGALGTIRAQEVVA
jgi:hypothetical protein